MRTLIRRIHREERGATIAIVAVSLIALFGMVVLTVDVGGLVVRRRAMVNANDAAALAAAQAFALEENGAVCGSIEDPARDQADALAESNVSGSSRTVFQTDCIEQTVEVVYERDQDLFFAPVLGFSDTATVNATATAVWGSAGGGNPVPIELDPQRTRECVYNDPDDPDAGYKPPGACPQGYWFDPLDTGANSSWGLLSLNEWAPDDGANDPFAGCSATGGSSDLGDWITEANSVSVVLAQVPTYVCSRNGSSTSTWLDPLRARVGDILLFPINDPAQMVVDNPWLPTQIDAPNTSLEKFAIVGFAPMKVDAVLDGDDPLAIGTPGVTGASGDCGNNGTPLGLSLAGTRDLQQLMAADCEAPAVIDNIPYTDISVFYQAGGNRVEYAKCPPIGGTNCDYRYDETTFTLTWVQPLTQTDGQTKLLSGTWSMEDTPGTPGACSPPGTSGVGPTQPEARAFCLALSWAGPQLIGSNPQPGSGFGAQSVTLVK